MVLQTPGQVHSRYPKLIENLVGRLNLDHPGMERVKKAAQSDPPARIASEILNYYTSKSDGTVSKLFPDNPPPKDLGDLTNDYFTFQLVRGKQPRVASGLYDWANRGPNNDREWAYFLNRHAYLRDNLGAYKDTGDNQYARYFNDTMQDWIISNPTPRIYGGSLIWRNLETSLRMSGVWPVTFFGFRKVPEFSDATRLLMISSIYDHLDLIFRHHTKAGNILVMNLTGLLFGAVCFPEFKESHKWATYAVRLLEKELLEVQIYPDGAQKELTMHYHLVALSNFERANLAAELIGIRFSPRYRARLKEMWSYIAKCVRPTGYGLLNNDSNLDYVLPRLIGASKDYNTPEWVYYATNGTDGLPPEGSSSYFFPYAGHAIMRSGSPANTAVNHWAFFDIGPWGTGHQHNDKLHLSVFVGDRDILVDSGRYWYRPDKWRNQYFRHTRSHNTALIDGAGQKSYRKVASKSLIHQFLHSSEFDFTIGTFDGGYMKEKLLPNVPMWNFPRNSVSHTRSVCYVRNEFWVVVDHFRSKSKNRRRKRKRKATILWHFHPSCTVELQQNLVQTVDNNHGNLRIIPNFLTPEDCTVAMFKGAESPAIQGWYSESYNHKIPSTCAEFTVNFSGGLIVTWLLIPGKEVIPNLTLSTVDHIGERLHISVMKDAKKYLFMDLPLAIDNTRPLAVHIKKREYS